MKGFVKIVVVLGIAAAGWWGWNAWKSEEGIQIQYKTTSLEKSDFRLTIDSTGTVEPTELVEVSAQVTGIILELGKDMAGKTVDYASEVKQGQLLARIDDVVVANDIKRAEASIAQSKANIAQCEANILQAKAQHRQTQRDRERAEKLGPGDALSQSSYDQYISSEEAARAAVSVSEAALEQAKASLLAAEAALVIEKRNQEYTTITSPVDGTIITRLYNVGSTVVSNMSATTMFYVAKDLSQIQVWAAVNEADIANIHPGQKVLFSVDAFPGRSFSGKVNKIRPNATMTSNVVTYIVEVDAKNPDKILRPYMTADVNFIVQDLKDVFVVPNAALRFTPSLDMIDPSIKEEFKKKSEELYAKTQEDVAKTDGRGKEPEKELSVVWEQKGNFVSPIWVKAGETNGMVTPLESGDLKEDMPIVLSAMRGDGSSADDSEESATNNPFMMKMPRRNKNQNKKSSGGPPPHP